MLLTLPHLSHTTFPLPILFYISFVSESGFDSHIFHESYLHPTYSPPYTSILQQSTRTNLLRITFHVQNTLYSFIHYRILYVTPYIRYYDQRVLPLPLTLKGIWGYIHTILFLCLFFFCIGIYLKQFSTNLRNRVVVNLQRIQIKIFRNS